MSKEHIQRFVEYLCRLKEEENRTALAHLRRGLGKIPETIPAEMYRYVVRFLTNDMKPWEQNNYFLVASLFALHPKHEPGVTMGKTFSLIAPPASEGRASIERRFVHLLNGHHEDLPDRLRHVVSLARSKDVPIDYAQLLDDLRWWDDERRRVRQQWARDFWTPETPAKPAESETAYTAP